MSSYSHSSRSLELQGSGNYGLAGISSTPGDQRDTGSGHSYIKIIPDPAKSPYTFWTTAGLNGNLGFIAPRQSVKEDLA